MSIYHEVPSSKANRIEGAVYGVSNSRRIRPTVSSNYKIGGASSGKWSLGRAGERSTISRSIRGPRKLRPSSRRKGR